MPSLQKSLFLLCTVVAARAAFSQSPEFIGQPSEQIGVESANDSRQFTDPGSMWFSGSFSYSSFGAEDQSDRVNLISATPIVLFFPAKYFAVGPRLQWTGMYTERTSTNQIGIGVDLGFAYKKENSAVLYVRAATLFNTYNHSYEYFDNYGKETSSVSAEGATVSFLAGVLVPVGEVVALQIEPSYSIVTMDSETANMFGVSFGFAFVGKRSCVSALHSLSTFF